MPPTVKITHKQVSTEIYASFHNSNGHLKHPANS